MSLLVLRGHHIGEADSWPASLITSLSPIAQVAHKVKGSVVFNCLSMSESVLVAPHAQDVLAGIVARELDDC